MNFMGFTEGLCALSEEPEAVHELYQYLINFYSGILKKTIKLYKPDVVSVGDDTATAFNPFISVEMQREMIKPYHKVLCDIAREENIPLMMHCCGRCEDFIDDWMDIGVSSWNPAQVTNNLKAVKTKYGNKMVLIGCWDSSGPAGYVDAPEDLVRNAVKEAVMTYGPGGGYMFWGSTYGAPGPLLTNKRTWMTSEYEKWREAPYK
jgi:uroporphyrinogen-III decarboxylase